MANFNGGGPAPLRFDPSRPTLLPDGRRSYPPPAAYAPPAEEEPAPWRARPPLVEFAGPGHVLPLREALNLSLPPLPFESLRVAELNRFHKPANPPPEQQLLDVEYHVKKLNASTQALRQEVLSRLPSGPQLAVPNLYEGGERVRVLVAVLSTCCGPEHRAKRDAIRQTWKRRTLELHTNVHVKFFLAQGTGAATGAYSEGGPPLEGRGGAGVRGDSEDDVAAMELEAREHRDLVVLRGREDYSLLSLKTLQLLKYSLLSPSFYTHIVKTDDDCYLRFDQILRSFKASPKAAPRNDTADPLGLDPAAAAAAAAVLPGAPPVVGTGLSAALPPLAPPPTAVTAARAALDPSTDDDDNDPSAPLRYAFQRVYVGCVEAQQGFVPVRNPSSKWFLSEEEVPSHVLPKGVRYTAGWGYVLSREVVAHALARVDAYETGAAPPPGWWGPWGRGVMKWEDVLLGFLVSDYVQEPTDDRERFRPSWRSCPASTAIVHLDVDSPRVLRSLYEQEVAGIWDHKTVQCSTGDFLNGDYSSWKHWRNTVAASPI
jgi:hypothetical protein